ncbi:MULTISPECIES: mycofactocin precursor MftA [Streptomyces]|nr:MULTISPECIES: mycofactocin precursor MftA [unclassified Streptomyces]QTI89548.1 mycofactocin precursor [Streptomyces sp. AgN23]RSS38751.1 mycofactocin precursor [Streptomyces sp. WAC05858]WTB04849.1 mycofactocin precursor MftA [Streptomyces antimycoticus]
MHAVQDETRSAHRAAEAAEAAEAAVDDVAEEVLVEEVSIDGMCGVY